jgi:glycosyltransferase involved in cell wall biosynthesis
MSATISVVVIACDEAHLLRACLESVAGWADELVVVDLESEDATVAVAEEYGARVVRHSRVPFADPARNFAFAQATCDWILMLDPDERVRPELAALLRSTSAEGSYDVADIPYVQMAFGRALTNPGAFEGTHPRFFRRSVAEWPAEIHGFPRFDGLPRFDISERDSWRIEGLYIVHDSWRSPHQVLEKFSRYVAYDAQRRRSSGVRFSPREMRRALGGELRRRFIDGRAYDDGLPGIFHAAFFVLMEFAVYVEIWEAEGRPEWNQREAAKWVRRFQYATRAAEIVRLGPSGVARAIGQRRRSPDRPLPER